MRTTAPSRRVLSAAAALTVATFALVGCSAPADSGEEGTAPATGTITITDNHGEIEVPVNPQRVVALDNHVFETLDSWGVELVAAPKPIMGTGLWPNYTENDEVLDAGAHFEPNLEAIIEAQPDLIIGGYRFSASYDAIVEQNPQAVVIELEPLAGEDAATELKEQVEILGQIFQKEDEAQEIIDAFDQAIADATEAYNGEDTVIGLITSAGEIGYVAPVTGRSLGVLFPQLGLVPAIEQDAEDTSHGDDISVEAIAAANPDWLIVLDRDGSGVGEGEYTSAQDLIEGSEALANVTAVQKGQIIYLDPNFYLTEDIQAYTALYEQIAAAFTDAS